MNDFIKIEGYKCFLEQTIPLKNLTVLAGGNSVGKSSVIQAILLMRNAFEKQDNYSKRIPLNGDYRLSLGDSVKIVSKKYIESFINFTLSSNGSSVNIKLGFIEGNPEVYLKLDEFLIQNEPPITQPNFHYLHAERLGPRPLYDIGVLERNVGWQGEFTAAILGSNEAKSSVYNVTEDKKFEQTGILRLDKQVENWMNYIVPGVNYNAEKLDKINKSAINFNDNSPYNVGFGISYVLPVITAGLIARKGEMLIVENPEAHLHPSGQSRIGQFLAKMAGAGIQVIVETHSEHVVNGIRLAVLKGDLSNEEVVFNFFSPSENDKQPVVNSINLNQQADLTEWPRGFFDQAQQDLIEMIKRKRKAP
ncbi:MAG: DUF3696 domain-containing protein [Chitinophagales bacterium]